MRKCLEDSHFMQILLFTYALERLMVARERTIVYLNDSIACK